MGGKRLTSGAGPDFSQLHELPLLACLERAPSVPSFLLEGALKLTSKGPVERVCRRWRRLALQLPASLELDLCELHEQFDEADEVQAALDEVLPALRQRAVRKLELNGCTLTLAGGSLPHFSSYLSHCRCLESLELRIPDLEEGGMELVGTHLSGLEPQLRLLCLSFNVPPRLLLACVASHVRPAAVALSTHSGPCAWMWVPQLRALSVYLRDGGLGGDCARLGQGIAAMPQLESLTVLDVRPPASAPPYVLPGLAALPRLAKLSVQGSVPRGAWECPHLTALLCAAVSRLHLPTHAGPPQPRLRCTGLRQLRLVDCSFEAEASFPSTLCTLSQLTSLALLWNHGDMAAPELAQLQQQARLRGGLLGSGTRSALPPAFSQLSALRQLVIHEAKLDSASVEALRPLGALTVLRLPRCQLQGLPDGPYLAGLSSLEIGHNPGLDEVVPHQATAARGLRALKTRVPAHWTVEEDWSDLQRRLNCLPCLQLLCLEAAPGLDDEEWEGLKELLRPYPFELHADCCALDLHPEYSGLADFTIESSAAGAP